MPSHAEPRRARREGLLTSIATSATGDPSETGPPGFQRSTLRASASPREPIPVLISPPTPSPIREPTPPAFFASSRAPLLPETHFHAETPSPPRLVKGNGVRSVRLTLEQEALARSCSISAAWHPVPEPPNPMRSRCVTDPIAPSQSGEKSGCYRGHPSDHSENARLDDSRFGTGST